MVVPADKCSAPVSPIWGADQMSADTHPDIATSVGALELATKMPTSKTFTDVEVENAPEDVSHHE